VVCASDFALLVVQQRANQHQQESALWFKLKTDVEMVSSNQVKLNGVDRKFHLGTVFQTLQDAKT